MKTNNLISIMLGHIKYKILVFVFFLTSTLVLSACGGDGSVAPASSNKQLSGKLLPPEGDKIYFGAMTNFGNLEDDVTQNKIEDFDKLAGKPTAWSYFSNNWTTLDSSNNHSPEIRYPSEAIRTIHDTGKTPFIRLLPWTSPHQVPSSPKARQSEAINLTSVCTSSGEFSHKETKLIAISELTEYLNTGDTEGSCMNDFSMQSIIDGDWDADLTQWVQDSLADTDDKGNPHPLLITFAVEMNGSWFPWSGIYNGGATTDQYGDPDLADGPERFRDAYRHIIELFREEGADHITWFFAPDTINPNETWMKFLPQDWNNPSNYYPGDDYIDWIGFTLYGAGNDLHHWKIFSEELSKKAAQISNISNNKPIALLETGVIDLDADNLLDWQKSELATRMGQHTKSEWLEDTIETILDSNLLNIRAISYWNATWNSGAFTVDMRINSSAESLVTFRDLISNPRFISELQFSQ